MKQVVITICRTIFILWAVITIAWFASRPAEAATPRGKSATYQFRKHNACPSTAMYTGACPGWRMDHMHSLRCGGPDTPENLWWLTVEEHKAKLKPEAQCWRYFQGPRNEPR